MRFGFFLLVATQLSVASVSAQTSKKIKHHADMLMSKGNYKAAVNYYHRAMEYDSSDAELNFGYAKALHQTNNYREAARYYERAAALDRKREYALALFYAAETYKIIGSYYKSQKEYRKFIRRYKGDKTKYEYRKAQYELGHLRELKLLQIDTLNINLANDDEVNTGSSEFAPFFLSGNSLLFSSLRSDSVSGGLILDTADYRSKIYRSDLGSGWKVGRVFSGLETSVGYHVANSVLSPDGRHGYFTTCTDVGRCRIFRSRVEEGIWKDSRALPEEINLPGTTSSQPFLVRVDGEDILYFVSDRPGGRGNLDIWSSVAYSNGLFSDPVNLGDSVNSPGRDICPYFMVEENTLYFSSEWYAGLGGFDIFRCRRESGSFRSPENLGLPINSSYNDLYFRYRSGQAVLVSNRDGSVSDSYKNCCNDLFFFDYRPNLVKREEDFSNIDRIKRLLPIKLFFNNDEPNPKSLDTVTSVIYSAALINYLAKLNDYKREYSKGLKGHEKEDSEAEIATFFENEVSMGYEDLREVLSLMLVELEGGKHMTLEIKGFASPLSRSDYNRKLTLRRISCVENELIHFNRGTFLPYIENGQLEILRYPFGEDRVLAGVSDDLNDKRNAVYSKKAAFERRVEIISVDLEN